MQLRSVSERPRPQQGVVRASSRPAPPAPRTAAALRMMRPPAPRAHARSKGLRTAAAATEAAPATTRSSSSSQQQDDDATQPPHVLPNATLIFNPVAGQEDPAAILGDVALKLSDKFNLTVCQTKPDVSPEALAKQALAAGADVVVASGGDGTVGAVAGVLAGSGVPLGIIPRGTANAFSVALGIPTHLDDADNFGKQAADVILDGFTKDVDTALVDTSDVRDYAMILLLGIGYEAEMCDAADRDLKNALGPLAYIISGVQKLLSVSNFHARVWVDGEEAEGDVAAITIANAAPPFSVLAHGHTGNCIYDDGLLEAIGYVAEDGGGVGAQVNNLVDMAYLFGNALFGGEEPVRDEERIFGGRYKEIRVECDPPQKVVLDGELLGTTPVTARVRPNSLKVFVPRPAAPADEAAGEAAADDADNAQRAVSVSAAAAKQGSVSIAQADETDLAVENMLVVAPATKNDSE